MMKKTVYFSTLLVLLFFVFSCEKDFREISSNVVANNNFDTEKVVLDLEIEPYRIDVRADDIALGTLGEYWLGVYNKPGFIKLEGSIITQFSLPASAATLITDKVDTLHTIDAVYLKLPYSSSVSIRETTDPLPKFRIDSILGNTSVPSNIKVYKNETFLNSLNPTDPTELNEYLSNASYITGELLSQDPAGFEFIPNPNDTILPLKRRDSQGNEYNDTIRILSSNTNVISTPFIAIPLNKDRMKELLWDKILDNTISSQDVLNNEFRGLIIESTGDDGAAVPLSLSNASLDIYYTRTILESGVVKERDSLTLPFNFTGRITNSRYLKGTPVGAGGSATNVNLQGTSGSAARIKILNPEQLENLRSENILINDASLVFNVDASTDTTKLPRRLTVYREGLKNGEIVSGHVKDSYSESAFFGGNLELAISKPDKYTLRITDYISDIVSGDTDNSDLVLKVYNPTTDDPFVPGSNPPAIDTIVKKYNWNPRGISILNNASQNGDKRAKLILTYSKEKESN